MKFLLLVAALAMPAISWMSQRRVFGPDNATISDRYPTLLVAAGYAFAIWGLIFLLDVMFGLWQLGSKRAEHGPVKRIRSLAAIGFALTAAWMVVFSMQQFWLALLVIWGALAAVALAMLVLARAELTSSDAWLALLPLALHAGWLSLAVFLNTAQVVVAFKLLPVDNMLPWSLALWVCAGGLLLTLNAQLAKASAAYVVAALWGLVGVFVAQSGNNLPGANASAWVAALLGVALLAQTLYLRLRRLGLRAQASPMRRLPEHAP